MKLKIPQEEYDAWKDKQRCPEDPLAEGYGMAPFHRAERWATLMESRFAADPDAPFEQIAEETERQAGRDADAEDALDAGITGFQFGCVMQILAVSWVEGEALRRWHNQKWGLKPENDNGGVVNPAILVLRSKDDQ